MALAESGRSAGARHTLRGGPRLVLLVAKVGHAGRLVDPWVPNHRVGQALARHLDRALPAPVDNLRARDPVMSAETMLRQPVTVPALQEPAAALGRRRARRARDASAAAAGAAKPRRPGRRAHAEPRA